MTIAFTRRTAAQSGEVTIRIHQDGGDVLGEVTGPGAERQDAPLGVHQALAAAIELAEHHGQSVGVIDEDDLWREEWGELA